MSTRRATLQRTLSASEQIGFKPNEFLEASQAEDFPEEPTPSQEIAEVFGDLNIAALSNYNDEEAEPSAEDLAKVVPKAKMSRQNSLTAAQKKTQLKARMPNLSSRFSIHHIP